MGIQMQYGYQLKDGITDASCFHSCVLLSSASGFILRLVPLILPRWQPTVLKLCAFFFMASKREKSSPQAWSILEYIHFNSVYCTSEGEWPSLDNRGHQWECYTLTGIDNSLPSEMGSPNQRSVLPRSSAVSFCDSLFSFLKQIKFVCLNSGKIINIEQIIKFSLESTLGIKQYTPLSSSSTAFLFVRGIIGEDALGQ